MVFINALKHGLKRYSIDPDEYFYTVTSTTAKTTTTTENVNLLPFIIGGVVGVIALLAIGIGLYWYCIKRKKDSGGQSKALNTSGTTVNTGTTGTTATGTGTTATGTGTTATARY